MATLTIGGKTVVTQTGTDEPIMTSNVVMDNVNLNNVTFPAGHIVQMTTNTMDSVYAITETVNMQEILSCSITPKFNTSKIIINMTVHLWHMNYHTGKVCIFRDTTRIGIGTDTTNSFGGSQGEYGIGIRLGHYASGFTYSSNGQAWAPQPFGLTYIDIPGTSGTSITYYLKGTTGNASYPLYVNSGSDTADSPRPISTITLLEVVS